MIELLLALILPPLQTIDSAWEWLKTPPGLALLVALTVVAVLVEGYTRSRRSQTRASR
jgi:hypothetical protein